MNQTFIATILLSLRRTACTFGNTYHHFRCSQFLSTFLSFVKPTPSRFEVRVINFTPSGRGWFTIALRLIPLAIKGSSFEKKHLRKARLVRMHPLHGGQGWVSFLNNKITFLINDKHQHCN